MVADLTDDAHFMSDENDGQLETAIDVLEQPQDGKRRLRVERRCRLVAKEDFRPMNKRALPPTSIERQRLLNDLKRHRLIRLAPNFSMDDEDALLAIRPTILGIISDDMLEAALEPEPLPAGAGSEAEADGLQAGVEEEFATQGIEGNAE